MIFDRFSQWGMGFLVGCVACAATALALPPMSLYELPLSQGRGSVRALCPTGDGRMWVGSDQLFLFDGESFTIVPLPDGRTIQGIARDASGHPWIVGPGVIGWLEQDAQGVWRLHSLARELEAAGVSILEESWRVGATAEGMVLVTGRQILRWERDHFRVWDLTAKLRLVPLWSGGRVWFYRHGFGVLRLDSTGPRLVLPMHDLPGAPVTWILAGVGGQLSILGTSNGAFARFGDSWHRLPALSKALAGATGLRAVDLGGGRFAVGAYSGGVVVATTGDAVETLIDRAAGLPNDYTYSLAADEHANLWVGLQGMVARIRAQGSTDLVDKREGLKELPVAKLLAHQGRTYALTSKALYDLGPAGSPALARSADFPGYLWDAAGSGGNLFVGGFGGVWRRADGSAGWIHEVVEASDVCCLEATPSIPGGVMFLRGDALTALAPGPNGTWTVEDLGAAVANSPLSEVAVGPDEVWVSTQGYGIFQFRWRKDLPSAPRLELVRDFRLGLDLPSALTHAMLTVVGGGLFALSPGGVWVYAPGRGRFEAVPALNGFAGVAAASAHAADCGYWIVRNRSVGQLAATALVRVKAVGRPPAVALDFLEVPGLDDAGRISTMSLLPGGAEPTLWIGASRALLQIVPSRLSVFPPSPRVRLNRVERNNAELAPLAPTDRVSFNPDTGRLEFEFSSQTAVTGELVGYQTRLAPVETKWSIPQSQPGRTFSGLASGGYVFSARTVNALGRTGEPLDYPFVILAPWYERRSTILLALATALGLAAIAFEHRRRAQRRQTDYLNRLVAERTRELALANAAKNEFLESISHEIRNPLNGVIGLAEMLRDAPLQSEERALTRSLGACAESLSRIFEDVLALSKLEYGYVSIEQKAFGLVPLLEEVIALFAVPARRQGNVIRLELPAGWSDGFVGDPAKLKTIVTNFVGNALKYAPGRPVEIGVAAVNEDPRPDSRIQVTIRVTDQGPGIVAEEQAMLFRKFVRGAAAKASGAGGTGLGLASARAVAELLGGKVAVRSEPGQGATFSVMVPLKRGRWPARSVAAAPAVALAGARALIVEDRDYNQIVLKGLAQKLGYAADLAGRAEEAIALAERQRYAVVFLDWELPGLNGGAVARRLRQQTQTRDAVIIATTAHDTEDIREQCRDAGMDGFAVKPYNVADMKATLRECAARRQGQATGSSPAGEPSGPTREIDLDTFRLFAAGDPGRADEAMTLYLETLERDVAELGRSVDHRDFPGVARLTHQIRSHASLVGDTALNDAARMLREKGADAEFADYQAAYHRVVVRSESLKSILREAMAVGPLVGDGAGEVVRRSCDRFEAAS